jgi:hypothetical protein
MASSKNIALLERKYKEAKTNKERSILKKSIAALKEKLSKEQKTEALPKARRVVKKLSSVDFRELIARLKQRPEYAFLNRMGIGKIKDDYRVVGKPVGWRIKGKNNYEKPSATFRRENPSQVYFENRVNRSDVKRTNRLAKGGMTEHGLKTGDKIVGRSGNTGVKIYNKQSHESGSINLDSGKRSVSEYAKGGHIMHKSHRLDGASMARGGSVKASVGDMVNIKDPKSLYNGKSGVIMSDEGNFWLVKTTQGTGMVSKSKVMIVDSMARGGFVGKGQMVWGKLSESKRLDVLEQILGKQYTSMDKQIMAKRAWNFLPRNVKVAFEAKYANVEDYAKGGKAKEKDPPIIRSYVDDEGFEYEDGGEISRQERRQSLKGQPQFKF